MIGEYLLGKAFDEVFSAAKRALKGSNAKLASTTADIDESIRHHIEFVTSWSGEISFIDLKNSKRTTDVFIEPFLYVLPRRRRIQVDEKVESVSLKDLVNSASNHCALLGLPGAGKTTSMKYLCQAIFLDDKLGCENISLPLVIRIRDLNNVDLSEDAPILFNQICNILGLRVELPAAQMELKLAGQRKSLIEKLVIGTLESIGVLLILDGFDELTATDKRERTLEDIRKLASQLKKSMMIVTSRTGEFEYNIENVAHYELCPLTKDQISQFSKQWLGDNEKAQGFLRQIYQSPFMDTTVRPLTLAHLAAIYERIGEIPKKPKTVYRKVVGLMLEEWDQQRSVRRSSRYAAFEIDRKFEFLCSLSYILTALLGRTVFSKEDLLEIYKNIYQDYDLIQGEAHQVVNELETHTGLFLQTSYETFEFAHKSLQEYLTAEYLVRLPKIPDEISVLTKLPNELAIAVTISSHPSSYLDELVFNRLLRVQGWAGDLRPGLTVEFIKTMVGRLLLEKPDFPKGTQNGLSLLTLHSLILGDYSRHVSNQPQYVDRVGGEFEHFVKQVLPASTVSMIFESFEMTKIHKAGGDVYVLYRKGQARGGGGSSVGKEYPLIDRLPSPLYVRSFLLDIESPKGQPHA